MTWLHELAGSVHDATDPGTLDEAYAGPEKARLRFGWLLRIFEAGLDVAEKIIGAEAVALIEEAELEEDAGEGRNLSAAVVGAVGAAKELTRQAGQLDIRRLGSFDP